MISDFLKKKKQKKQLGNNVIFEEGRHKKCMVG